MNHCELKKSIIEFTNKYLDHLLNRLDYLREYEKKLLNEKPIFKGSKEINEFNIRLVKEEIIDIEKKINEEKKDLSHLLNKIE